MHLLFVIDVESNESKKSLTENFVYKAVLHYVEKEKGNLMWDFMFSRRSTMIKLKKEPVFSKVMKNEVMSFKTTFTNILLKLKDRGRKRQNSFSFSTPLKTNNTNNNKKKQKVLSNFKIFEKIFEYYNDLSECANEELVVFYVHEFEASTNFEDNIQSLPFKKVSFYWVNTVCLNVSLEKVEKGQVCFYKHGLLDLIHCFYYDISYCVDNKFDYNLATTTNNSESLYSIKSISNKENNGSVCVNKNGNFAAVKRFVKSDLSKSEHVFRVNKTLNKQPDISISDITLSDVSHCVSEAAIHDSVTKKDNPEKCMVADCAESVNKFLFYERKINLNSNKKKLLDNLMSSVFTDMDDLLANKFNYSAQNQVLNYLKQAVYRIVVYDKFVNLIKNDENNKLAERFFSEISTLFHHVALHAGPHFTLNQLKNYILPKFDVNSSHLKELFELLYARLNVENPFGMHDCTVATYASSPDCSSVSSFNSSIYKNNENKAKKFDEKVLLKKRPNLYMSSGQVRVLGQKRRIAATSNNNLSNSFDVNNKKCLPVKRVLFSASTKNIIPNKNTKMTSKSTADFKPSRHVSQLIDNHLRFVQSSDNESFSNSPIDYTKKNLGNVNFASWTPLKLYNMNNPSSADNNSSGAKNDENVQEVEKVSVNSLISPYKVRTFDNTNPPKEQPPKKIN